MKEYFKLSNEEKMEYVKERREHVSKFIILYFIFFIIIILFIISSNNIYKYCPDNSIKILSKCYYDNGTVVDFYINKQKEKLNSNINISIICLFILLIIIISTRHMAMFKIPTSENI